MAPVIWQPDRTAALPPWPVPPLLTAIGRGVRGLCPACGEAPAFGRFLKIVPVCPACAAPLGSARADDAPPYFTILLVGHIVIPLILLTQNIFSDWELAAIFLPLTLALCLAFLQPVKGAVLGVMVTFGMMKLPEPAE